MAAPISIHSFRKEILYLEKIIPHSAVELQEKFNNLSLLIKANHNFSNITHINKKLDNIYCLVNELKEKELKYSSEKNDKNLFVRACVEIERLFYMINNYSKEEENALTESLEKIINQVLSKEISFSSDEAKELLLCLPLITNEANRMKLARALIPEGTNFLEKNLNLFQLSNDSKFEIIMQLVKKLSLCLTIEDLAFKDSYKRDALARFIAKEYPIFFWDMDKGCYLGITDRIQLFELMKISFENQDHSQFLWQKARIMFFTEDREKLFQLTKIFLLNHDWLKSWVWNEESSLSPERCLWKPEQYLELAGAALERRIKIGLRADNYPPIEIRSCIEICIRNGKGIDRKLIQKLAILDISCGSSLRLWANLLQIDELLNVLRETILESRVDIGKEVWEINDRLKNPKIIKEYYHELKEFAHLIFMYRPEAIICCEWLRREDQLILSQKAIFNNPTAAIGVLGLLFLDQVVIPKEDYSFILEVAEIVIKCEHKNPIDIRLSGLVKLLKPHDFLALAKIAISKADNNIYVLSRWISDQDSRVKKEFLSEILEIVLMAGENALKENNTRIACAIIFLVKKIKEIAEIKYSQILEIAELAIKNIELNDDILKITSLFLTPSDFINLANKSLSKKGINMKIVSDWMITQDEKIKKEFYPEVLEFAKTAILKDIRAIKYTGKIFSEKDYIELIKMALNPKIYRPFFRMNRANTESEISENIKFLKEVAGLVINVNEGAGYKKNNILWNMLKELAYNSIKQQGKVNGFWEKSLSKNRLLSLCTFAVLRGYSTDEVIENPTSSRFCPFSSEELAKINLHLFEKKAAQLNETSTRKHIKNICKKIQVRYPLEKSLIKSVFRGLLLMEKPVTNFELFQMAELSKEDPLFSLIFPILQEIEHLSEKERVACITKHEPALKWLGFLELKWNVMKLSKMKWEASLPIIKEIMNLQYPQLRYELSHILCAQVSQKFSLPFIEVESKLEKDEGTKLGSLLKISGEGAELFQMLLQPYFHSVGGDWRFVAKFLSNPKVQIGSSKIAIITCLTAIFTNDVLTINEKGIFIKSLFTKLSDFGLKEAVEILRETQALFSFEEEFLTRLVDFDFHKSSPKEVIETFLTQAFCEKLEISHIEAIGKELTSLIVKARQPNAIFIYFSKLQNLPKLEKEIAVNALSVFMESVIKGTFPNIRYRTEGNPHLEQILKVLKRGFQEWVKGDIASVEELLQEAGQALVLKEIDLKKELYKKVCSDDHFFFFDESSTKPSFLKQYLIDPREDLKIELSNSLRIVDEKLMRMKKEAKEKFPETIEYKELNNILVKLRIQRQLIDSLDKNCKDPITKLNSALKLFKENKENFPETIQVIADLELCKCLVQEKDKSRRLIDLSKYKVIDTDDWEDMLLCGTEVSGSCQHIDRDPQLNKCLLGYILDGKIRIIVVKDENGKIVARRILRLLLDNKTKSPVLYQEWLYANPGVPKEVIQALDAMVLRRAKKMDLSLVTTREEKEMEEKEKSHFPSYPNDLVSLSSPYSYEYVDAGSLKITDGKYTIPSRITELINIKKISRFYDEIHQLRLRLM